MKIAIIGTGPSAIAALEELVNTKNQIYIFDIGKNLPEKNLGIKNILREKDPTSWTNKQYKIITKNPSVKKSLIPKKTIFGSEYPYFYDKNIQLNHVNCYASQAKGGFFNVWGAAMLPMYENDMRDWPIKQSDLSIYYKKILDVIPYSFKNDGLTRFFSTFNKKSSAIKIPNQAHNLIRSINNLNSQKIFCGQSRLAIYQNGEKKCRYCGTCLTGCVYDSIYNSLDHLNILLEKENVIYRDDTEVLKYSENDNKVKIFFKGSQNKKGFDIFDKVFIGAGPLNTAKIVINSNKNINEVIFSDSQKFIIPIITFDKLDIGIKKISSLCTIFLEYIFNKKSIVHMQVSHYNDLLKQKIPSLIEPYISFFTKRLLIGWCGINSKYSHKIHLFKKNNKFFAIKKKNNGTYLYIFQFSLIFFLKMLRIGRLSSPFPFIADVGGGNHFGASFPMKKKPTKSNETDINGKLIDHKNVYLIDSSVLPNIPSTTLAFTTMANSKRIINNVLKQKN